LGLTGLLQVSAGIKIHIYCEDITILSLMDFRLGRRLISSSASSASATRFIVDKDGSEPPLSSLAMLSCFVFNRFAKSS